MGFYGTIGLVFALVAVGYLVAWSGVLRKNAGEALGDFVITVAIPVLLFRTLAEADFAGAEPTKLWVTYFTAIGTTWALATVAIRRGFSRDARSGVVAGLASSFSNLVLLGIPLILAVFGQAGFETLSLLLAVHLPVMMAASVILNERAERLDGVREGASSVAEVLVRFLRNMAKNPIVIGILAGLLWRLSPVRLPVIATEVIDRVAEVAGTLALISLGMSLRRFGIARNLTQAITTSLHKLGVMPAVATLVALALSLPPDVAHVVILCAAMPAGVNPYLIANRFGTAEALASNTMVVATALSPLTLLFWLWLARTLF